MAEQDIRYVAGGAKRASDAIRVTIKTLIATGVEPGVFGTILKISAREGSDTGSFQDKVVAEKFGIMLEGHN